MAASVEGLDGLLAALDDAAEEATDRDVNKAAANVVLVAAKPKAPVASGKLKGSGKASATQSIGKVRFGGPGIPWAGPAIFGAPPPRKQGGFNRPNPFVFEAGDERADAVAEVYLRATERALNRHLT